MLGIYNSVLQLYMLFRLGSQIVYLSDFVLNALTIVRFSYMVTS